jgi:hypothetical protein
MDFNAADLLNSLFNGRTLAADDPPAPAACECSPTGDGTVVVAHVEALAVVPGGPPPGSEDDPLAGTPFAGWVQRPDFRGRLRWEAPDLPESARWWARCAFEDLPEPTRPTGPVMGQTAAFQDCAPCDETSTVDSLGPAGPAARPGAFAGPWRA